jgi:hypothetical protein
VEQETQGFLRGKGGPGGWGVEGALGTFEALAHGRVRVLVLAEEPSDRRAAWFGPVP